MTTAQRARLVVAMGLLNLILATVALTAGFVAPPRPSDGIALGSPAPTLAPGPSEIAPSATTPSLAPRSSGEPAPSAVTPPVAPSAVTTPSTRPPDAGPVVAVIPTPQPTAGQPTATAPNPTGPNPTVVPPALPTARPTARPTATPNPVVGNVHKARPPCPDRTSGPPGHHKVTPPPARPCGGGTDQGKGSGGSGVVVVPPLAIGGLAAALRMRLVRGSGRTVRGLPSNRIRRRERASGEA